MQFQGKTAFITGAGSGIGRALALATAQRGANVMLADRDQAGLDATRALLAGLNVGVDSVVCDVARHGELEAAAERTIARFGKVHALFNNAGVSLAGRPGETPMADWRWIVDINLMGVVSGVEIFTPLIRQHQEGGHICNTASMAGHVAGPSFAPYTATKFAVVGYSEGLRIDLARDNIGVSVLCPAWVRTGIHTTALGRPSAAGLDNDAMLANTAFQKARTVVEAGLEPVDVANWTLDCMEANRFYVFTHADFEALIDARHEHIRADYAASRAHFSTSD